MAQDGTPDSPQENPAGDQSPDPTQQVPPASYQQQPQPTYPPNYGHLPQYPEESGAVTALVVSILSLAVCSGLISPIGWMLANKELAAISEGRRDPTKRDMAKAAQIISIVGSILLGLAALFLIGILVIAVIGAAAGA